MSRLIFVIDIVVYWTYLYLKI